MLSNAKTTFAVGFMTFITAGCGGADPSDPIMAEPKHSHYHVHAPDASHEHSHADENVGGHEHAHEHSGRGQESN
jgi:hypothetical protein